MVWAGCFASKGRVEWANHQGGVPNRFARAEDLMSRVTRPYDLSAFRREPGRPVVATRRLLRYASEVLREREDTHTQSEQAKDSHLRGHGRAGMAQSSNTPAISQRTSGRHRAGSARGQPERVPKGSDSAGLLAVSNAQRNTLFRLFYIAPQAANGKPRFFNSQ